MLGEHRAPGVGRQLGVQPHRRLARDVLRHLGPLGLRFYGDHPTRSPVLDINAELFAQGREEPRTGERQVKGHAAVHGLRPDQGAVRSRSARAESGALQEGDAKALLGQLVGHRAADHSTAHDQNVRASHERNRVGR